MSDFGVPPTLDGGPHPATLLIALDLVTRQRLRLTDARDSRLEQLAGQYDLGAASWTGPRAAFVGFYTPPTDPSQAGVDLANRCQAASLWGSERLAVQGAERCDIVLIALGPLGGEIAVPPTTGPVQVGAVCVDLTSGEARQLIPSPGGLPGAREVSAAVKAVLAGQASPTLAAVDLAERQTVAGGYAQPVASALRQVPIVTYSLIALWVALWIGEQVTGYSNLAQTSQSFCGDHVCDAAVFVPTQLDWWRFLSSAFVHDPTSPLHLGFNCFFMWQIGRHVELLYGRMVLLGTFVISALMGSLFVLLGNNLHITNVPGALGASGGLCGFLTLMLVIGIREGRSVPAGLKDMLQRNGKINVIFILIYSVALSSVIAVGAHVGGFVGGAIAGLILPPLARVGGRDLRLWEKGLIVVLIAAAGASLLAAGADVISLGQ